MDVSVLQHANDKHPRQVAVEEVVAMIRGEAWPPGYGPLLVAGAVVEGGLQRKHVRWLTGLSAVHITGHGDGSMGSHDGITGSHDGSISGDGQPPWATDPHVVLSWADGSGGRYVVFLYEVSEGFRTDQQMRYYGRAFQWGCNYFERLLGAAADRTGVAVTHAVPLRRDPQVWYNDAAMPFVAADINGKPPDTQRANGMRTATNAEIKQYLADHIFLRRNVVTCRVEYRDIGSPDWLPIDDVRQNSLWDGMSEAMAKEGRSVDYNNLDRIINSDYAPPYHPFRDYLEALPRWDGTTDPILALSVTVQVKGGYDEQMFFYSCLKKWLVAMVAGWVDQQEVNQAILVLLGRQGIYKTTWFSYLLPPELRQYFYTKTNSSTMTKDDRLVLAQYGLVCCEELDTMRPSEMNQLKSLVTARFLDERAAYARYHEHRKHIASFCATGNNAQFLNDATGTRRWLPFEVESITSPRDIPHDYDGIYAQAYALYRQGFPYYFTEAETERLQHHNEQFETPCLERDIIEEYFRRPADNEPCEFIRTSIAAREVSLPGMHVSTVEMGRAFTRLGFRAGVRNHTRGFYVVRIPPDERRRRAQALPPAMHGDPTDGTSQADEVTDAQM